MGSGCWGGCGATLSNQTKQQPTLQPGLQIPHPPLPDRPDPHAQHDVERADRGHERVLRRDGGLDARVRRPPDPVGAAGRSGRRPQGCRAGGGGRVGGLVGGRMGFWVVVRAVKNVSFFFLSFLRIAKRSKTTTNQTKNQKPNGTRRFWEFNSFFPSFFLPFFTFSWYGIGFLRYMVKRGGEEDLMG